MRVQLELYASLMRYLPAGAQRFGFSTDVPASTTIQQLLDRYGVPREQAHLVLRNGIFVTASVRDSTDLAEGDVVAVWPPVAGG